MSAEPAHGKAQGVVLPEHLWHAGRAPVAQIRLADRTEGQNAANSGLGLFCASRPHDYILNFGPHVYRLTLAPGLRVLSWTIRDLADWGQDHRRPDALDRAWFIEEGRRLAESFDVIALHELGGFLSQVIVLTDQAIAQACLMAPEEFQRICYDVAEDLKATRRA